MEHNHVETGILRVLAAIYSTAIVWTTGSMWTMPISELLIIRHTKYRNNLTGASKSDFLLPE